MAEKHTFPEWRDMIIEALVSCGEPGFPILALSCKQTRGHLFWSALAQDLRVGPKPQNGKKSFFQ